MTVFGADPMKLYQVGKVTLPNISAAYATATRRLHGIGGVQGVSSMGSADLGRIYSAWAGLRDDMQNCLAETADIYLDVGNALVSAADGYGYTDDEHASKLRKIESDVLKPPSKEDLIVKWPGDPQS